MPVEDRRPRRKADMLIGGLILSALCVGAGASYQGHADGLEAAKLISEMAVERQHERDAFTEREKHLVSLIDTERKEHARDAQESHNRQLGFVRNAGRMRSSLETLLTDSRRGTADCAARIDAIAGAVGELIATASEGAGLLEQAEAKNRELAAKNSELAKQVRALQQFAKGPERVTVTAPKR